MRQAALSEEDLIQGCIRRDKQSWDEFVGRYSKLIYWSIRKTLPEPPDGDPALADEIFQEVFERLLEKELLTRLKTAGGIKAFLCVLACHATLDKLKGLRRYQSRAFSLEGGASSEDGSRVLGEKLAGPGALGPESQAIARERSALVENALSGLSPREKFCVELYYFEGQSHGQIAGVLGMPVDTVSTLIRRAREKLKEEFRRKGIAEA